MRKRIVEPALAPGSKVPGAWLDLEQLATVEVTSEAPGFPIESALRSDGGSGWRASGKGEQLIRIIFDQPLSITRIYLRFVEAEVERTQEFTLRWAGGEGAPVREIVRQQWNFSPSGSTIQAEDYRVEISGVRVLELAIRPDLGKGSAPASLAEWRIA